MEKSPDTVFSSELPLLGGVSSSIANTPDGYVLDAKAQFGEISLSEIDKFSGMAKLLEHSNHQLYAGIDNWKWFMEGRMQITDEISAAIRAYGERGQLTFSHGRNLELSLSGGHDKPASVDIYYISGGKQQGE